MKKIWYIKPHNQQLSKQQLELLSKLEDGIFIQTEAIPEHAANWTLLNDAKGKYLGQLAFGGWINEKLAEVLCG